MAEQTLGEILRSIPREGRLRDVYSPPADLWDPDRILKGMGPPEGSAADYYLRKVFGLPVQEQAWSYGVMPGLPPSTSHSAELTKVVDRAGKPKQVYHGTRHEFAKFSIKDKADPGAMYGPGVYFTENPRVAAGYAGKPLQVDYKAYVDSVGEAQVPKPNIRPAHLDITKPFDIDAPVPAKEAERVVSIAAKHLAPEMADILRKSVTNYWRGGGGKPTGDKLYEYLSANLGGGGRGGRAIASQVLAEAGYDGITHIGGANTGTEPHRVWIAFDPKQIINPYEYTQTLRQFLSGAKSGTGGR